MDEGRIMAKKLWQASKNQELESSVEAFETRDDLLIDQKLVKYDCIGSLVQAKMLRKINILTDTELKSLESTLKEIIKLDGEGKFNLRAGDEDVHTKIENFLVKKCGSAGRKIHTGRSRNDQVATALRLYMKDKLQDLARQIVFLIVVLEKFSNLYGKLPMSGYTHMQKAMPSTISLWIGSFRESLADDLEIIKAVIKIIDKSPLGSGAGYGVPLDLKRDYTAKLLGFSKVQENSLYCQNSRGKYEALILSALVSILQTLNKLATDVMLFTTEEYGFFSLEGSLTTGSSIMPQKKNPDLVELIRSKLHVVVGNYATVVSLSSNLPSGYNRDLQDSKKPLMESLEITHETIQVSGLLVGSLIPNEKKLKQSMTDDLYAAEKAFGLVKKGMAFRDAYQEVAKKIQRSRRR